MKTCQKRDYYGKKINSEIKILRVQGLLGFFSISLKGKFFWLILWWCI
jgi:hypothetical protein